MGYFQNFALRETRPMVMISFTDEDRLSFSRRPPTIVAASGPAIWTSTYGLEPVLCNRLLIELSGWAQTVHMFTQRFT